MTGRTHLTIGIATGLAVGTWLHAPPQELALITLMAALGSLFPDIDHPQSLISGYIPGSGLVGLFTRHRGITHSLIVALWNPAMVWSIISYFDPLGNLTYFPAGYAIVFMFGMLSHLIADMLTPAGVPLLLPVSQRNFKLAPGFALRLFKWSGLESVVWLGALLAIGIILAQGIDPAQIARMVDFLASMFPIHHDSPLEI